MQRPAPIPAQAFALVFTVGAAAGVIVVIAMVVHPGLPVLHPDQPSPDAASRIAAGELSDFPYLPELPSRGPVARHGWTAGLLVDIPVEITPRGWRPAKRPGRDLGRPRSRLSNGLDVMEDVRAGYRGTAEDPGRRPHGRCIALELPPTLNVGTADTIVHCCSLVSYPV
jgi:hypothetical protein